MCLLVIAFVPDLLFEVCVASRLRASWFYTIVLCVDVRFCGAWPGMIGSLCVFSFWE